MVLMPKLQTWWQNGNKHTEFCDKSFVLWTTETCCSADKAPAPRPALGPPGSSEESEPCHHLHSETAAAEHLSTQWPKTATAEAEQSDPQVSLYCTSCPQ